MSRFGLGLFGQQSRRFVVKHTFLDVIDSPVPAEFALGSGLRVRASSDPNLYEKFEAEAEAREAAPPAEDKEEGREDASVAFELCGLSDAETASLEPSDVGTGCDSASTPRDRQPDFEVPPAAEAAGAGARPAAPEEAQGRGAAVAAPAPAPLSSCQANVDQLLFENTRLQMENRLLRERFAETSAAATVAAPQEFAPCPWGFAPGAMGFMAVPCAVGMWDAGAIQQPMGAPTPARRQQKGPRKAEGVASGARGLGKSATGRSDAVQDGDGTRTTVMLRNLPNNYTRSMLLGMLDEEGFAGLYNFVYLPIDFKSRASLGYAFVNLVDTITVPHFWKTFDGYSSWVVPSRKVCHVSWSGPHQGLQAHIDRYRNSPIMHASVPDECKPVLFEDGARVEFPAPTKSTRAPRIRNMGAKAGNGGNGHGCNNPQFGMRETVRQAFLMG